MGANVINFPKPRPSGDCESRAKPHREARGRVWKPEPA